MFVPMKLLAALAVLAAIPVLVAAIAAHVAMRDAGLALLGRREFYLDGGVRLERWFVLYVPVFTRHGWHSTALLD